MSGPGGRNAYNAIHFAGLPAPAIFIWSTRIDQRTWGFLDRRETKTGSSNSKRLFELLDVAAAPPALGSQFLRMFHKGFCVSEEIWKVRRVSNPQGKKLI